MCYSPSVKEKVLSLDQCLFPNGTLDTLILQVSDASRLVQRTVYHLTNPLEKFTGVYMNWYNDEIIEGLSKLAATLTSLNARNLWSNYFSYPNGDDITCGDKAVHNRMIDGTCNSLELPLMGSKNMRFGRNILPLRDAAKANLSQLMNPNPRKLSLELLSLNNDGIHLVTLLRAN